MKTYILEIKETYDDDGEVVAEIKAIVRKKPDMERLHLGEWELLP